MTIELNVAMKCKIKLFLEIGIAGIELGMIFEISTCIFLRIFLCLGEKSRQNYAPLGMAVDKVASMLLG